MVMIDINHSCPRCNYPFLVDAKKPNSLKCPSCKRTFTIYKKDL